MPASALPAFGREIGQGWRLLGSFQVPSRARGRRRAGRGWWASHQRRGRPRPTRYGSSAPHVWQWRDGARLARRAIVAAAALVSSALALTDRPLAKMRQESRNPAEETHSRGASQPAPRRPMVYPAPAPSSRPCSSCTSGTAPRCWRSRTARRPRRAGRPGRRSGRWSGGGAAEARAPVAGLAAPRAQHAGGEALPGPRSVDRAVPARG